MANAGEVKIKVDLDLGTATKQLKLLVNTIDALEKSGTMDLNKLSQSFDKLEKEMDDLKKKPLKLPTAGTAPAKSVGGFSGAIGKASAALGPYAIAIGATVTGIKTAINATKEWVAASNIQNEAEQRLTHTLQSRGLGKNIDEFKQFASEVQSSTTIGDEAVLGIQSQIASYGVARKDINKTTKEVIGLAEAYKDSGLTTQMASKAVAQAQAGQWGMLERYMPTLRTFNTEAEKMAYVQEQAANGFEMATLAATTNEGKIAQFGNLYGDLQESMGDAVKNITGSLLEELQPILEDMIEWFAENKETITKVMKIIGVVIGTVVKFVVGRFMYFKDSIAESFSTGMTIIKSFYDYFKSIFSDIGEIAKAFGRAFLKIIKGDISGAKDEMMSMWDGILEGKGKRDKIISDMDVAVITSAKKMGKSFKENMLDGFTDGIDKIADIMYDNTDEKIVKPMGDVGAAAGEAYVTGLNDKIAEKIGATDGGILPETMEKRQVDGSFGDTIKQMPTEAPLENVEEPEIIIDRAQTINESIGYMFADTFMAIGDELDNTMGAAIDSIFDKSQSLGDVFKDLLKSLGKMAANSLIKALFLGVTGGASSGIGGIFSSIIPAFATGTGGAFVNTPTLFVAGEAGPEMVEFNGDKMRATPMNGGGGSGLTVNYNIGVLAGDRNSMQNFDRNKLSKAQADNERLRID